MSFRPLRRTNNAVSEEVAKALLLNEKRGVLAVNGDDGYPYAIPVDYLYDEAAGKIYFHGAKQGHKVDSIKKNDKVCFTVFGNEQHDDDWAPTVQSTVVFGRCHLLETDDAAVELLRKVADKYYPTKEEAEEEIVKAGRAVQIYEIEIEHLCGKQIREK